MLSHETFQKELLSMKLIFLMSVKLQMNLTLSLQTSGENWQVKFGMLQLRILNEQIRFYHGNKTTLDE